MTMILYRGERRQVSWSGRVLIPGDSDKLSMQTAMLGVTTKKAVQTIHSETLQISQGGLQGDPTSPFWRRSALGFLWKEWCKAETPVLWPPHGKSWLIGKDPDAGRDWGQEEKGTTEDEVAGWHHRLGGHEFEWTLGVGDGQGGLACCVSWDCKESDTTERLNWTELIFRIAWNKNETIEHSCFSYF